MNRYLLFLLLALVLINADALYSKNKSVDTDSSSVFSTPGSYTVKLFYGRTNASSIYDMEGSIHARLEDPNVIEDDEAREYWFQLLENNFGIMGDYVVNDKLRLYGSLPISHYSLYEETDTTVTVSYPDNPDETYQTSLDLVLADLSLFKVNYLALGLEYILYERKAYMTLLLEGRMPFGTHDGSRNDPKFEFLSDGYMETLSGIKLGVKLEKAALETSFLYNWRDEDWHDQIIINTKAALSTVEDTELGVFLNFVNSVDNFDGAVPLDTHFPTLQENYINLGGHFHIILSKEIYIGFDYKALVVGKNTLSNSGFFVSFGFCGR